MKILQIIQRPQLRGAEIFACQLSERLNANGVKTDVLILFGDERSPMPFDLQFFYLKASEQKRWWDIKAYKKLSNIIKNGGYDIVQANAGDTLKYAALSRFLFRWNAKLVFRNANKISDFINSPAKKLINSLLVSQVDFVASVSEECNKDFQQTFNYDPKKIASLPIGVNTNRVDATGVFTDVVFQGEGPYLLNVAGFVKEKNHAGLIRIFKSVLRSVPAAKLLLVGEGKLKAEIQQLCSQEGIAGAVFFLGRRNDVDNIMANCNALLLPSLIEGLPAVILEAFANRLPVVAYNVGGISEVVKNDYSGWLIGKGEEDLFADAVCTVLNSPTSAIQNITGNAARLVADEYDNQVIAVRFENTYRGLLDQHKQLLQ